MTLVKMYKSYFYIWTILLLEHTVTAESNVTVSKTVAYPDQTEEDDHPSVRRLGATSTNMGGLLETILEINKDDEASLRGPEDGRSYNKQRRLKKNRDRGASNKAAKKETSQFTTSSTKSTKSQKSGVRTSPPVPTTTTFNRTSWTSSSANTTSTTTTSRTTGTRGRGWARPTSDNIFNNTRRELLEETQFTTYEFLEPSPCDRVDAGLPDTWEWRERCKDYLDEPYVLKDCADTTEIVPRIYHSVSHGSTQTFLQRSTTIQNPSFVRNHLNDEEAAKFVFDFCGEEAYQAYRCFAPPAFRADLFRFCALYSQGGVYLDQDIFPFVPLEELYSPCSTATIGHDFPWMDKKGKQMKILASAPGAPIFLCAIQNIISSVRNRIYPETELELTGPQLLHKCYEQHLEDVSITYHDTRNALWPFTGLRRGQEILAYEIPTVNSKHFWLEGGKDTEDYSQMFKDRIVYRDTCELSGS